MPINTPQLLAAAHNLSRKLYGRIVFIGSVAIQAHAKYSCILESEPPLDGDFCISAADFATLKLDLAGMRGASLSHSRADTYLMLWKGCEFNIYVEGRHSLAIPWVDTDDHAEQIDGLRVACLEHLLLLTGTAAERRKATAKGRKDLRNLARTIVLLERPRAEIFFCCLRQPAWRAMKAVGDDTILKIANGDIDRAKDFSARIRRLLGWIDGGCEWPDDAISLQP